MVRAGFTLKKNYRDLKGVTKVQLTGMAPPPSERSRGVVYISVVLAGGIRFDLGFQRILTLLLVKMQKAGPFLVPRTLKGELEENSLKCLPQQYLTHFSLQVSSHPG